MHIGKCGMFGLAAATGLQAAVTLDFELDSVGTLANGATSVGSSLVSFSNQQSFDSLQILDAGTSQTIGQSLVVQPEVGGVLLEMNFSSPIYSLSLMFGNDDPGLLDMTSGFEDLAVLNVYDGTTLLDVVTLIPNANTDLDQTISWIHSGTAANRVEFFYGDKDQNPIDLIETVDNITFDTTVPEPSTYAALGFASVVGAFAWRRRRKKS